MPSKNSAVGRKGIVKWNDGSQPIHWAVSLPTVLDRERDYYEQKVAVGQPDIDNAVRTWFKVYHSLVWLVAATNQNCYPVNAPFNGKVDCVECSENPLARGEDYCLKESHLVPAFTPDESGCRDSDPDCDEIEYDLPVDEDIGNANVGNEVRKGWIFQDLKKTFDNRNSEQALATLGRGFAEQIYQEVTSEPLLQSFLAKFKQLSSDFDVTTGIDDCLKTRSEIELHDKAQKNGYIGRAIELIKDLWDEQQLAIHLEDMRRWVADTSNQPAGSREWLERQLGLTSIQQRINSLFNSDNLEAKKMVSRWTTVLLINKTSLTHIFNRLAKEENDLVAHSLETAIANLAMSEAVRQKWNDLLYATYGAVAWQIFHQANVAATQVLEILKGVRIDE
jgi:hypothetical protein